MLDLATARDTYESEEGWLAGLRVLSGAVQTALNTQLKADENSMQQARLSRFDEILRLIAEEEKRMVVLN